MKKIMLIYESPLCSVVAVMDNSVICSSAMFDKYTEEPFVWNENQVMN